METERIAIEGMHCANCSALIQKMVGKMDGVESCEVNLAANNGTVEFDPAVTNMPAVIETIVDLGYGATVIPRGGRAAFDEERRAREAQTTCSLGTSAARMTARRACSGLWVILCPHVRLTQLLVRYRRL